MAKEPANVRAIYSPDRHYPGCLRGIINFFDVAERKLLTNTRNSHGLEDPGNSSRFKDGISGVLNPSSVKHDEIAFKYGMCEPPISRGSNGMPMKDLIAQELSKEAAPKIQSPNVVAQLMGLDALPVDPKFMHNPIEVTSLGDSVLKPQTGRHCREKKPLYNTELSPKMVKTAALYRQQQMSVSRRNEQHGADVDDDKAGCEIHSSCNNSQDKQLQEFREGREALQSLKSWESPRSIGLHLDKHLTAKEKLAFKKMNELNLAFANKGHVTLSHGASHEGFKELLEAMNFLWSNKDLFSKSLQDPTSSFARHLQKSNLDSESSSQLRPPMKHRSAYRTIDPHGSRKEVRRPHLTGKELLEPKRSFRTEQRAHRRPGENLLSIPHRQMVASLGTESSLMLQDQEKKFPLISTGNRISNSDGQAPTKIVVLKPGSGRVQNLKSSSLSCPSDGQTSSRAAREVDRDNAQDVLEEMRKRLRKDSKKEQRRLARQSGHDGYGDDHRNPREIAREIARQVRESVSRDLVLSRALSGLATRRRTSSSRPAIDQVADSSIWKTSIATELPYWDDYNRSITFPSTPVKHIKSFETKHPLGGKDAQKRGSDRSRIWNAEQTQTHENQCRWQSLMNNVNPPEHCEQISTQFRPSRGLRIPNTGCLDGFNGNLTHQSRQVRLDANRSDADLKFKVPGTLEGLTHCRIEEESKYSSHGILLRAESIRNYSKSGDKSQRLLQLKRKGASTDQLCETVAEKLGNFLLESKRTKVDAVMQSILSRKLLSLNGSFSLGTEGGANKGLGNQHSFPTEEPVVFNLREDASAAAHEAQSKIDDSEASVNLSPHLSEYRSPVEKQNLEVSLVAGSQIQQINFSSVACENTSQILEEGTVANQQESDHQWTQPLAVLENFDILPQGFPEISGTQCSLANETTSNAEACNDEFELTTSVSVLDSSAIEEIASSVDFKEANLKLQDLRSRLQLLKCAEKDIPGPDLQILQNEQHLVIGNRTLVACDDCSQRDSHFHKTAESNLSLSNVEYSKGESNFGGDEDEACPTGREMDMLYVKDILTSSGFSSGITSIIKRWYAPSQPLDPQLFQRMEENYSCKKAETQMASQINNAKELFDTCSRRLLFDCVNEVLLKLLGHYLDGCPWLRTSKGTGRSMPTRKELVKYTWMEVCRLSSSESDISEDWVAKDLTRAGLWMNLTDHIETVGLDLETAILNDLIEETILVL